MYHVIRFKQTRGIINVTLRAAKESIDGSWSRFNCFYRVAEWHTKSSPKSIRSSNDSNHVSFYSILALMYHTHSVPLHLILLVYYRIVISMFECTSHANFYPNFKRFGRGGSETLFKFLKILCWFWIRSYVKKLCKKSNLDMLISIGW